MSEVIINEQNLIDIADAIRLKLGVQTEYKPSEMAEAIEEIEGGTYGTKEIDSNGIYDALDDGYTGYSQVTVNVQGGGGEEGPDLSKTAFTLFGYPQQYNSNYTYLDNYIVNNFKNGDAAIFTNKYLEDTTKPWEIGVMFKVSALLTRSQVLFGAWSNYYKAPSLEIGTTGVLWLGYTNTAGTWTKGLRSEYVLDLDTWYFAKVTYSPSDNLLTLAITKDFTNWNTETADVTGYQYTDGINSAFEFGGLARSSNHCATNVSIDIRNTYIKEDGEITWGCYYREETPQTDKVKVLKRIGYLYDGWYITAAGVLKYDPLDLECFLEIFEVQAGHKYIWCFGSNNGNRGTVAFTEHDIYNDPVDNLSLSFKFKLEDAERIAYQSKPILNITSDGYIGAYIANAMGTDSESYLIDITDIDD